MLDIHPPEGAIVRSQAAWMPPLGSLILEIQGDASSSLRHHGLASLGMSRQCVLPCLGARSSLLSRRHPDAPFLFSPWKKRGVRRLRRSIAELLGVTVSAIGY